MSVASSPGSAIGCQGKGADMVAGAVEKTVVEAECMSVEGRTRTEEEWLLQIWLSGFT